MLSGSKSQREIIARIAGGRAIVALSAPPGFRKTQIALEAAQEISRATNSPVVTFGGIEHARDPRMAANCLCDGAAPIVLIEDPMLADTEWLGLSLAQLARAPHGRRVILTRQSDDGLPLSKLAASGTIDILDANLLRLRRGEVQEAISRITPQRARGRLSDLIGSWPVALDLLTTWAAGFRGDWDGLSDLDIIRESALGDFIEEEVLSLLTADERLALINASMLETADIAILSSVVSGQDYGRIVAALAYRLRGLIDRDGAQVQLQPALRIWLRDAAVIADGGDRQALLIAMADHCSDRGRLAEAAALARMAGDSARIRSYAQIHGALRIWIIHGFSVLKGLLDNSTAEDIAASPVLRMIQCIVHLKAGQVHLAEQLFGALAQELGPDDPLASDLEIVRVTLLVYGCSMERSGDLELLKRLTAKQGEDPAMGTFIATLSAILNCQRARFDTATANLMDARAQAERASSRYNLLFLAMHEAAINIAQGKLKAARTCLSDARRRWQREFAHDVGVETVIAALSASIEFESGQLTSARNSLRKSANRMPEAEAWFDIYFAAYETMIRIRIADHGLATMLIAVENEALKLRAQGLSRVSNLIIAIARCAEHEARLHGQVIASPTHWTLPPIGPTTSWQEQEVFSLVQAYELYFAGDHAPAFALLQDQVRIAQAHGLARSQLRYLLAIVTLSADCGAADEAMTALRGAIRIGAATGMRQIFHEVMRKRFAPLLQRVSDDQALGDAEAAFLRTLLNRLAEVPREAGGALSQREIEILRGLNEGGSDKQIARQLALSEHGVRFHLKSIFKKMGVHNRTAASAKFRDTEHA